MNRTNVTLNLYLDDIDEHIDLHVELERFQDGIGDYECHGQSGNESFNNVKVIDYKWDSDNRDTEDVERINDALELELEKDDTLLELLLLAY
jgi:hypothetical protein